MGPLEMIVFQWGQTHSLAMWIWIYVDKVTILSDCETDSDCPDYFACEVEKGCVVPPCPNCGDHAHCEGSNHTGICVCNSNFHGNPYPDCKGN